jgi:hypothetical protein
MQNKRWIPYFFILLLLAGVIWLVSREPPPKIPQSPTIKGEVKGINHVTLLAFLPTADQHRIMLFLDFQKAKYGNLPHGFVIYFFNDFHKTPTNYPFSGEQMKHLCAVYHYNSKEGVDQLSWTIPPAKAALDTPY